MFQSEVISLQYNKSYVDACHIRTQNTYQLPDLYACLSVGIYVYAYLSPSACVFSPVCLSVSLSTYVFAYFSACTPLRLFLSSLRVYHSVCLSACLFYCPSFHLFVYVSFPLPRCLVLLPNVSCMPEQSTVS